MNEARKKAATMSDTKTSYNWRSRKTTKRAPRRRARKRKAATSAATRRSATRGRGWEIAQNAAHAAFAGQRTVTPRSRDGMIESLRVLMACRKTAVSARRVALQMIHNTIVCAPDGLRDQLRSLTRMQLVRTLASWRPDLTAYRDLEFRLSHRPQVPGPPLPRTA